MRSHPGKAGGDLGVEHVGHVSVQAPAQQRDVLAAGVHDHLDLRIGEDRRQRRAVEILRERVDEPDPLSVAGIRVAGFPVFSGTAS